MLRRLIPVWLSLILLALACPSAAAGEAFSVSLGAAPDDYILVDPGPEGREAPIAELEGLTYRPQRTETGTLRVTTGDVTAAAALRDKPELLAQRQLTAEDVYLSGGALLPMETEASGTRKEASLIEPDLEDYRSLVRRVLALHAGLTEAVEATADPAVQAVTEAYAALGEDGKTLLSTLDALYEREQSRTGLPAQEYQSDLMAFIKTRLPDMGRDFCLGLERVSGQLAQTVSDEQARSAVEEALFDSQEAAALGALLERARSLNVPNTHAVSLRADEVNQIIRNMAPDSLAGQEFALSIGGQAYSLTVEAVLERVNADPLPGKALAESMNASQYVTRQAGVTDGGKALQGGGYTQVEPLPLETSESIALGVQVGPVIGAGQDREEPETATVTPRAELYRQGKRTLTLERVELVPGQSLRLWVSLFNGGKTPVSYCVTGAVLDGYLFPLATDAFQTVEAGETGTMSASLPPSAEVLLALAGKAAPQTLAVEYLVTADGKTQRDTGAAVTLSESGGLAAALEVPDTLLFDDNHLRVSALAYQPQYGKALLLLEATKGAAWETVTVDAVYDGCRALQPQSFRLKAGGKALCLLSVSADCPWLGLNRVDGMEAYLTFRHGAKQRSAYRLTLGQPSRAGAAVEATVPVFQWEGCAVRFLGAAEGYFADGKALLFQVDNQTQDILYLLCTNGYAYLDGQRADVLEYGTACYPGAVSRVAIAVKDGGGLPLAEQEKCGLRLSLYGQSGWYLREKARSLGLNLLLR